MGVFGSGASGGRVPANLVGIALGLVIVVTISWVLEVSNRSTQVIATSALGDQVLYVLDGAPDGDHVHAEVLEVEIRDGKSHVVHRYPLGIDADIALSPDGGRLYGVSRIITNKDIRDSLRIFETRSQQLVAEVPLRFRLQDNAGGRRISPKIMVSPDGSYVYILVGSRVRRPGGIPSIATFDTGAGAMLPEIVPIQGCGPGPAILPGDGRSITVVCRAVNELRFLEVSRQGGAEGETRLQLPRPLGVVSDQHGKAVDVGYISDAVLSADGRHLYAVTRAGLLYSVDVDGRSLTETVDLSLPEGLLVAVPQLALSSDGRQLLLGLSSIEDRDTINARWLATVQIGGWQGVRTIETDRLWSFVDGASSGWAFGIDLGSGGLSAVDTERAISGTTLVDVGDQPEVILASS